MGELLILWRKVRLLHHYSSWTFFGANEWKLNEVEWTTERLNEWGLGLRFDWIRMQTTIAYRQWKNVMMKWAKSPQVSKALDGNLSASLVTPPISPSHRQQQPQANHRQLPPRTSHTGEGNLQLVLVSFKRYVPYTARSAFCFLFQPPQCRQPPLFHIVPLQDKGALRAPWRFYLAHTRTITKCEDSTSIFYVISLYSYYYQP